ncbi:MAG: 50S ribosomal protein L29 [Candidatus Moeniiplasma glomeromycotorum]|nr:50S ribosomal protein L29 [Candidatus Moeniiplasma glomeromycotorum]MCE8167724.1 50S ribosomal protein L29 [Candidatus Moeniiplasma glomeromycotorum]MCE8169124.1 50S ribosomal protein L29 [Candidatus Moeniiplasma glomeromycotorum]
MSKAEKPKTKSEKKPELGHSPVELLKEYRTKLNLLRIQHKMGNLHPQQVYQLRILRKDIARLLTKMRSDQIKNIKL